MKIIAALGFVIYVGMLSLFLISLNFRTRDKVKDFFLVVGLFIYYGGLRDLPRKIRDMVHLNLFFILFMLILFCMGARVDMAAGSDSKMIEYKMSTEITPVFSPGHRYSNPLDNPGRITQKFGVYNTLHEFKFRHAGLDISCRMGTKIKAIKSGRVIYSGWYGRYGKTVIIQHNNGVVSIYAHLSKIYRTIGTMVDAGNIIAASGSTGESTGPHLHLEIQKNNIPQNPSDYINFYRS